MNPRNQKRSSRLDGRLAAYATLAGAALAAPAFAPSCRREHCLQRCRQHQHPEHHIGYLFQRRHRRFHDNSGRGSRLGPESMEQQRVQFLGK